MTVFYEELDRKTAADGAAEAIFGSTAATQGPWSTELQHGGPPCALALREFERLAPTEGGHIARLSADFLGPVPVAPLTIRSRILKPGKRAQLLSAEIFANDRAVLSIRGWWRRQVTDLVPEVPDPASAEPFPDPDTVKTYEAETDLDRFLDRGWIAAMEFRYVLGGPGTPGPCKAWVRPRLPLLASEATSPTQSAVVVADGASGLSSALDFRTHLFSNLDLNLSFLRPPEGSWISVDATSSIDASGGGTTTSKFGDQRGVFGYGMQTLYVEPHGA